MQTEKVSFKKRLLLIGTVLSVFITGFILYVYLLVDQTSRDNIRNIESSQVISQLLARISDQLRQTERDIYELAMLPEEEYQLSVEKNLARLSELKNDLMAVHFDEVPESMHEGEVHREHHQQFVNLGLGLDKAFEKLREPVTRFIDNAMDVNKRFPGMPVLLNELLPRNNQFLEAADLAIIETKQNTSSKRLKNKTLSLFTDARYFWSQQANWVRLFVSNRYGVFGESQKSMEHSLQNRAVYMGEVKKVLAELIELEESGKLDLQQSLSLEEMKTVIDEYEPNFEKAREIYLSKEWRNDLNILRQDVKPGFVRAWNIIRELEEVLNQHNQQSINQSQDAATTVSLFVLLTGVIIFLTFYFGYVLFERIIRKPLIEISMALDAEAKGKPSNIPIRNYVEETNILIHAFGNMKEQVNFRQKRLESILDNAAEGIITIDEHGNIETFNIAAQQLFGYEMSEVLGKNISMLVPSPHRGHHDEYLAHLKNKQSNFAIGELREVYAQSKNGMTFPMSIKVSEMDLGGKHYYTAVVENISQRKAMIENLQRLAEHDSLTGLYNRHFFTEELEKFVLRKRRGDTNHSALLYIDLDNFKYINDTMGHLAGDQLIVEAGSLLKSRTRDTDVLARLGGDEFAILLYRADPLKLEDVAESFRKQFEEYIFKFDGQIVDVGCSIGATVLDESIDSKEQLLAKADFACHEAKRLGRNQIHVYVPEDDAGVSSMSNDIGWTRRIKHALENDRFVLAQQPIYNIGTGENNYYEILIRMLDENDNLIMPSGFLPAAERFSLMTQIDAWVIRHSMKYMETQSQVGNDIRLSINLSASSVEDENILNLIRDSINEFNINPANLIFEVTETIAMGNLQKASSMLRHLQELGCKTALDDFGIGYSSFAYLKDLPVDVVKIDGSFVRDIATDSLHHAMVRSINDIAHEMGKQTVAEFVENQSALAILSNLKVDFGQGYHLGKPEIVDRCMLESIDLHGEKKLA